MQDNNVDAIGNGQVIAYDKTLGRWLFIEDGSNSWFSTDYGSTWNAGGTPAAADTGNFNDRHLATVTTGGNTEIYMTGQATLQYTINGGATWTAGTATNFTVGALTYEPTDDRLYVTLTGTGVTAFRGFWYIPRTSPGGVWTQDFNINNARGIDCNHTNGTLVASTGSGSPGIWRKPYGGSWTATAISPISEIRSITYVPQVDRWLAWDTGFTQVYISDDDGTTFTLDATFPAFTNGGGIAYIEHRTRAFINDF